MTVATFPSCSLITLQPGFYWIAYQVDTAAGTWTAMSNTTVFPILGTNCRIAASGVAAGSLVNPAPTMTPTTSGVAGVKLWAVAN